MPKIHDPDGPATDRQKFGLFTRTGVDVREVRLTKQEAHDLIDLAKEVAPLVREELLKRGGTAKRDLPVAKKSGGDTVAPSTPAPTPGNTAADNTATPNESRETAVAPEAPPLASEAVLRRLGADSVLVLPPAIAQLLLPDSRFELTLTPDGILLRLIRN